MKPSFTIGIEEEYQTIDPVTRDLRSHIDTEIIEKSKPVYPIIKVLIIGAVEKPWIAPLAGWYRTYRLHG